MPVITGLLLGLSTLLFIGPVFFYLLEASLTRGVKAGFSVAVGIIIGDVICVLLALNGLGDYLTEPSVQKWFAGIGAILLLSFGIKYFFKPQIVAVTKTSSANTLVSDGVKGFLINFVNPFVFAVWIGFASYAKVQENGNVVIALVTALLIIFLTDCLKAFFANKISTLIQPKKLKITFKIFGILMIAFAIRLTFVFFSL